MILRVLHTPQDHIVVHRCGYKHIRRVVGLPHGNEIIVGSDNLTDIESTIHEYMFSLNNQEHYSIVWPLESRTPPENKHNEQIS